MTLNEFTTRSNPLGPTINSGSVLCAFPSVKRSPGRPPESAVAALKNATHRIGGGDITVDKTCAKVSIVGAGMQSHSGVASTMFEALFNQNINIKMISTSEIKISVIIDEADADKAVAAIHDAFIN